MNESEKPECSKLADDVTLYVWGGLANDLRPAVEAHLKECSSCSEFVSFMKEFIATARKDRASLDMLPGPHPDPSLIVDLEADKLDPETDRKVSLHLLDCGPCREAYLRLRSLSNEHFEERVLEVQAAPSSWPRVIKKLKKHVIDLGKTYGVDTHVGQVRVLRESERILTALPEDKTFGYLRPPKIISKNVEVTVGENTYGITLELKIVTRAKISCTVSFEVDAIRQSVKVPLAISLYSEGTDELTKTGEFPFMDTLGLGRFVISKEFSPGDLLLLVLSLEGNEQPITFRVPMKKRLAIDKPPKGETPFEKPLLNDLEKRIVQLVAQGYRNDAIGEKLSLSAAAVKEHLQSIFAKLGISNSSELTFYATNSGLIDRQ